MKISIADAIRNGSSVVDHKTELNELWSKSVTALHAAELLAQLADNESSDEVSLHCARTTAEMLKTLLGAIAHDLEHANAEICQAVNERQGRVAVAV